MSTRTNLVGTIVVAAALLVPVAQADDWATDGITAPEIAASTHPDNRAEARGPGAIAAQQAASKRVRPDDRAEPRGPGAVTPAVVVESSNGFDWSSAGIGMVGGMGAALLLAGALLLLLGQRSRTSTA
jgi:hypothetical protein